MEGQQSSLYDPLPPHDGQISVQDLMCPEFDTELDELFELQPLNARLDVRADGRGEEDPWSIAGCPCELSNDSQFSMLAGAGIAMETPTTEGERVYIDAGADSAVAVDGAGYGQQRAEPIPSTNLQQSKSTKRRIGSACETINPVGTRHKRLAQAGETSASTVSYSLAELQVMLYTDSVLLPAVRNSNQHPSACSVLYGMCRVANIDRCAAKHNGVCCKV